MRATRLLMAMVVLGSLVVGVSPAAGQQSTPDTTTPDDELTIHELLEITDKPPSEVSEAKKDAVIDWVSQNGNLDQLNVVEREQVSEWVDCATNGNCKPSLQDTVEDSQDTGEEVEMSLSGSTRIISHNFDSDGTLTLRIESDISGSYYSLNDIGAIACSPKGVSKVDRSYHTSGELAKGVNVITIQTEECKNNRGAVLQFNGDIYPIKATDGGSLITGPYGTTETRLVGVVGVLMGVSMVVVTIVLRRRKERKTVNRL